MTLVIDSIDETNSLDENELMQIENILSFAARKLSVETDSEISITFVSNERIQEINRDYRQKDKATDVISFAMEELGEGEVEVVGGNQPRILGDIIISIPKAKEQAEEYGHSFLRELGFLAVHGFLHLLGYDHENEADEKVMFSLQRELLDDYGLKR
ncbi:MAG TPA: rRNA maturation RNase YbeY [Pseudoneobacillus sp.]|nr:rRNA maturation RNase YbeY [Pseudoneobacillus sp.]